MSVQQQIIDTANEYGVDPNLALAVASTESGMNQGAVSSAGAVGVFQLMPSTAAGLGVNPYDVNGNIEGGVKYLSQLQDQFGGNTQLMLAAYNAGPGAVAKYGGIPPYPETQNYVDKITSMLGVDTSGVSGGSNMLWVLGAVAIGLVMVMGD